MWLMLVGNVGIVAAMSTLLLSFIDLEGGREGWIGVGSLSGGIGVLWALGSSEWVDRLTCRGISWAIGRWTSLDTRDDARLLHLREDYGVTDLRVQDGDNVFHAEAVAEQERVSVAERALASR